MKRVVKTQKYVANLSECIASTNTLKRNMKLNAECKLKVFYSTDLLIFFH